MTPTAYHLAADKLRAEPRRWLVTGAAGFIGSNLADALLGLGQEVVGLDNLETGHRRNIESAIAGGGAFTFIDGDIRDPRMCRRAAEGCAYVLHEAALGSVPKSLDDPAHANAANVEGFLNILLAARDAGSARIVYASSSAVYGDDDAEKKIEARIGHALSPYAVTKRVDELWAGVFGRAYGLSTVGLRYFNIYGPRQDPEAAYAAVIPKWTAEMLAGRRVTINGDGRTSRDFCHVDDVVQANILAAVAGPEADGTILNVASGEVTDLNALHAALSGALAEADVPASPPPLHGPFRDGDIRFSAADVTLAREVLGYAPRWPLREGLRQSIPYYMELFADAGRQSRRGG